MRVNQKRGETPHGAGETRAGGDDLQRNEAGRERPAILREAFFSLFWRVPDYSSSVSTATGSLRNGLGAPSASGGGGGGGSNPAGGSISISEYR